MKDKLVHYLDGVKASMFQDFAVLHEMPEPGFLEVRTSEFLANKLEECGYAVKRGLAQTGVSGTRRSGRSGLCVGLRADMDALLHVVDGGEKAIHSCGHDAHCTAVLYAAMALAHCGVPENGTLKILFQPAEEKLSGAREILKTGEIDDLDYLYGLHLRAVDELAFGKISPTIRHGASDVLLVEITGRQAHGARPHQGINAAEACAAVIDAVNAVHANPSVPHSAKVTMIKCGNATHNLIPDKAEMAFDVRAQTNAQMTQYREALTETISKSASINGASATMRWKGGVIAATDSDEAVAIAKETVTDVFGEKAVGPYLVTPGGEDFHEYAHRLKNLKATMLGIGADLKPGLHSPEMEFNIEAILNAAKALAVCAHKTFAACSQTKNREGRVI